MLPIQSNECPTLSKVSNFRQLAIKLSQRCTIKIKKFGMFEEGKNALRKASPFEQNYRIVVNKF